MSGIQGTDIMSHGAIQAMMQCHLTTVPSISATVTISPRSSNTGADNQSTAATHENKVET